MNSAQSHPGIAGAIVSISSGLVSFFAHSLVVVQWVAGVAAAIAAIASIASVIRHWDRPQ